MEAHFHHLLYRNPLASAADIAGFRLEGRAKLTFSDGRLRMENEWSADLGQQANFVLWCPEHFPDNIRVQWEFTPLREPGLCILFFGAMGRNGEDLFDSALRARTGEYDLYHHGDINALHVSYFRRKYEEERAFHTCNLRKSYGFHLVAQGADPIPSVIDCKSPYRVALTKLGPQVAFSINDLQIFNWLDDGETYGPLLGGGKIGFRQMAPLIAEYSNLEVYTI